MRTLVYDIEVLKVPCEVTGGWGNPEGMLFGTAVVYEYDTDLYSFFGPAQKDDLIRYLTGNTVISFNGIKFDNSVLLGNNYAESDANTTHWSDVDILLEVVRSKFGVGSVQEAEERVGRYTAHDGSIRLDALARGTLGLHKTGHGAKAPELIRENRWAEVFAYNLNDVRLIRKLYDFIQKYGYLIDGRGDRIDIPLQRRSILTGSNTRN